MDIQAGHRSNTVGGTRPSARDVISGNGWDGVHIFGMGTAGNVVTGDDIGVTADGTAAMGNVASGVAVFGGASGNTVGGMTPGSGDVISGNAGYGLYISDAGTTGNTVEGDSIGTDSSGTLALGNGSAGIIIQNGRSGNTIGGTEPRRHDVISGNGWNGDRHRLSRGRRAMSSPGDYSASPPTAPGRLDNAGQRRGHLRRRQRQRDRRDVAGSGDVISANLAFGVYISDPGTDGNVVEGDLIGTDSSGT